ATGATGSTGATGNTGAQGFSVSMQGVAPGTADCSGAGGVKLTLVDEHGNTVSEPEFVCDGAPGAQGQTGPAGPPGPAGTTGQSSQTYFSNAFKSTNAGACDWNQPTNNVHPGFPVTINVPANVDVLIT